MPSVLISGASRGIGLEFARQYAADHWRVYASCRDPAHADALKAIKGQISIHAYEVTEKASLDRLYSELKNVPIDVLIANAGVSGPRAMQVDQIDRESWLETLAINAIAPVALAGAFRGNLEKSEMKIAVAISSRLGSIGENDGGGLYAYRSSKSALNQAWRSLAIDWKSSGIACFVLHPGWVQTDMGGMRADLTPETSVSGMRKVIGGAAAASGHFYNYDGQEIPW